MLTCQSQIRGESHSQVSLLANIAAGARRTGPVLESPRLNTVQPVYTIDGIKRPAKRSFVKAEFKPETKVDIWKRIESFQANHIMRGMNAVGYCANSQCVNFHRWVCISLGYGRFTDQKVSEVARCELCPSKAMCKQPYVILGMFFKECTWAIEECVTKAELPNPPALESWRGRTIRVVLYSDSSRLPTTSFTLWTPFSMETNTERTEYALNHWTKQR